MKAGLATQIFTLELRKIMSYRLDFWASFLGTVLVEFCIAYFLWQAIYSHNDTDTMNGFTFPAMMLYYLLVPITGHIVMAQVMSFMSNEIYQGSLNKYLVYPLNFFSYKYISHLAFSFVGVLQLGLVLLLYIWFFDVPESISLTPMSVIRCLIAAFFSCTLYFLLASCLEMISFWADNIWSLLSMLRMSARLLGGGLIPLAFFPDWSVELLRYLPFYCFTALPVEVAMGHLTTGQWLAKIGVTCFWILVFGGLARLIWSRGKLQYTGVGI